jgi:small nuclear ribonucleoprotein (snRNP)-like protein
MARKQLKSGDYFKGKLKQILTNLNIDLLSKEEGLVYKEEVVFEDGTVYRGQVRQIQESPSKSMATIIRNTVRHGYGL